MNRMLTMVLVLGASGAVMAADAQLPERRVESVSVVQAESSAPVAAAAAAPAVVKPALPTSVGVSHWLELQASGRVASPVIQGQTAAEQELVNQRFLDSYANPTSQASPTAGTNSSNTSGVTQ